MAYIAPTTEPTQLRAGDSWRWTRSLADYPATAWTLTYTLHSPVGIITLTAGRSGTDHVVAELPAATASHTAGRYDWISHVTDGTDRYQIGSGVIQILPNLTPAGRLAALTTGLAEAENAILWTAVPSGVSGNLISVALLNPGANNASLSASVIGYAVRVSLATGPTGAITSTASAVVSAVASTPATAALVTPTHVVGSDGSGVVSAVASTLLTGGVDTLTAYDGRSHARIMLDALNAIMEGRATDADVDVVRSTTGQRSAEWDPAHLLTLRRHYAAAVYAEDVASARARGQSAGLVQMRF